MVCFGLFVFWIDKLWFRTCCIFFLTKQSLHLTVEGWGYFLLTYYIINRGTDCGMGIIMQQQRPVQVTSQLKLLLFGLFFSYFIIVGFCFLLNRIIAFRKCAFIGNIVDFCFKCVCRVDFCPALDDPCNCECMWDVCDPSLVMTEWAVGALVWCLVQLLS